VAQGFSPAIQDGASSTNDGDRNRSSLHCASVNRYSGRRTMFIGLITMADHG
jgi:hypothetical protein